MQIYDGVNFGSAASQLQCYGLGEKLLFFNVKAICLILFKLEFTVLFRQNLRFCLYCHFFLIQKQLLCLDAFNFVFIEL